MLFKVRIYRNPQEQRYIYIEQPNGINLAYSSEIPEGWIFQSATPVR